MGNKNKAKFYFAENITILSAAFLSAATGLAGGLLTAGFCRAASAVFNASETSLLDPIDRGLVNDFTGGAFVSMAVPMCFLILAGIIKADQRFKNPAEGICIALIGITMPFAGLVGHSLLIDKLFPKKPYSPTACDVCAPVASAELLEPTQEKTPTPALVEGFDTCTVAKSTKPLFPCHRCD